MQTDLISASSGNQLIINHMITDLSNSKLAEIKAFATEHNLTESFNRTISRFETSSKSGCDTNLYSDFAPLSLYYEIFQEGKFILNGGFIFHGPHDGYGNRGAHAFSVCIDPEKEPGWSIHLDGMRNGENIWDVH